MRSLALICGIVLALGTAILDAEDSVLTCIEDKSTTIGWKRAGMLGEAGLVTEAQNPKKPAMLTFIRRQKDAILKGNQGSAELVRLAENTFAESAPLGNLIIWTVLPRQQDVPTYLITHKAYLLVGPFSITVAYKCQ